MAKLTSGQAATYLVDAGMPANRLAEFVAIGECESSLFTDAVSPVGAVGVWQIMPFNAGVGGGTVHDLYDPAYNARVTVIMSGHGANCAAWDTAYANIQRSGRYAYLNWPEVGSCAHNNLLGVAVTIGHGQPGHVTPPPPLTADGLLNAMLAGVNVIIHNGLPALGRQLTGYGQTADTLFRVGGK